MIIIKVKKGDKIEKYLKTYKRKYEERGIGKELKRKSRFIKPSQKRRNELSKAIYIQKLKMK